MNILYESELKDFIQNEAVTELVIERANNQAYQIIARLTWKEGDWHLVTTRKHIKTWASLDRLVRHLADYGNQPRITLKL